MSMLKVVLRNRRSFSQGVRFLCTDRLHLNAPEAIAIRETAKRQHYQHCNLAGKVTAEELEAAKRRRMIHRSKQCGMLEVDLVLGSWAAENVPKLSAEALDEYDKILQEETLDIFNMIARRSEIPSHLKDLSVMQSIMEYSWSNKSISLP